MGKSLGRLLLNHSLDINTINDILEHSATKVAKSLASWMVLDSRSHSVTLIC